MSPGLVCPPRTREGVGKGCCIKGGWRDGTREEPSTLTQGAPVFRGSSRWESNPNSRVAGARPNHQPIAEGLDLELLAVPNLGVRTQLRHQGAPERRRRGLASAILRICSPE